MGKYLIGLVGAGVLAVMVKSAADGMGQRLAAVRESRPAAKTDPLAPGLIPPGDGEGATILAFDDPLGYFRLMAPGTPAGVTADALRLHGIGRGFRLSSKERSLELTVHAEFVGADEPNTPRETLTWIVKKELARAQVPDSFDRVKFSRPVPGAEAAEHEREWRGNGASARRTRFVLVKKWLYTLAAHGLPDGLDGPDVAAFFDSFAVTGKALAHPDGGTWK